MNDKFMSLMEKKKKEGKEMDPMYKDSKMSMLKALKDEMSGMMSDDMKNGHAQKVEIAAPDKAGLSHGLDKAKELIEGSAGEESAESPEEEASESPKDEVMEAAENCSADEIDEMIKKLEEIKAQKSSGNSFGL